MVPEREEGLSDLELSQLDKVYLSNLANYNRIVNQRNHLLKEAAYNSDVLKTLDIWDMRACSLWQSDHSEKAGICRTDE